MSWSDVAGIVAVAAAAFNVAIAAVGVRRLARSRRQQAEMEALGEQMRNATGKLNAARAEVDARLAELGAIREQYREMWTRHFSAPLPEETRH
jgi:hypothetical protein